MSILILYKNKTYKIISEKKIKSINLNDSIIKRIFIPLYDNANSYIPIKPSHLYNFHIAKVSIIYQAFIYDYDECIGTSFTPNRFHAECKNLTEFINAIYNCYKFRGVTLYIDDNNQLSGAQPMAFVFAVRQIFIEFFDETNHKIDEIDSGIMKDLEEYSSNDFNTIPPSYICENRMHCLKDILYVPECIDNSEEADIEKLSKGILLGKDNLWKKVRKPSSELTSKDLLLYKIHDFEVYYLLPYELCMNLLNIKKFTIDYVSVPVSLPYDEDFLISLDSNKKPNLIEKEDTIEKYFNQDIVSITNISVDIFTIDEFLRSMVFFNTIMNYIKYFGTFCYAGEDTHIKMRNFAIFYREEGPVKHYTDKVLLTELELNQDTITDTFLMMKGW